MGINVGSQYDTRHNYVVLLYQIAKKKKLLCICNTAHEKLQ